MPFILDKDYLMRLYNTRVERLKDYINTNQMKASVIGLSGGIDSALATFMLKDAIGSENIYTLMLPSYESSESSITDAQKILKTLSIPEENTKIIEIGNIVELMLKQSGLDLKNIKPMIKGNVLSISNILSVSIYLSVFSSNELNMRSF